MHIHTYLYNLSNLRTNLFSRVKFLKKIDKSLTDTLNKHSDTMEYLDYLFHSKLRGKAIASKVLKKVTTTA